MNKSPFVMSKPYGSCLPQIYNKIALFKHIINSSPPEIRKKVSKSQTEFLEDMLKDFPFHSLYHCRSFYLLAEKKPPFFSGYYKDFDYIISEWLDNMTEQYISKDALIFKFENL